MKKILSLFSHYIKKKNKNNFFFCKNVEKKIIQDIYTKYIIKYFIIKTLRFLRLETFLRFFYKKLKNLILVKSL